MMMAEGSAGPRVDVDGAGERQAGYREWLALGVLMLAVLLLAVDATVMSPAVPA